MRRCIRRRRGKERRGRGRVPQVVRGAVLGQQGEGGIEVPEPAIGQVTGTVGSEAAGSQATPSEN